MLTHVALKHHRAATGWLKQEKTVFLNAKRNHATDNHHNKVCLVDKSMKTQQTGSVSTKIRHRRSCNQFRPSGPAGLIFK